MHTPGRVPTVMACVVPCHAMFIEIMIHMASVVCGLLSITQRHQSRVCSWISWYDTWILTGICNFMLNKWIDRDHTNYPITQQTWIIWIFPSPLPPHIAKNTMYRDISEGIYYVHISLGLMDNKLWYFMLSDVAVHFDGLVQDCNNSIANAVLH